MRIALEAADRLAILDAAEGARVVGAAFVVVGAVHSGFAGVACALVGFVGVLLSGERRIVIDRGVGVVSIDRRNGIAWTRSSYALSSIADIVLEESDGEVATGRFRVAFVLRDGTLVPWRRAYSRAAAGARPVVETVRRFLGTATLPPPPAPVHDPAQQSRRSRPGHTAS
jgi:hypothetical protein